MNLLTKGFGSNDRGSAYVHEAVDENAKAISALCSQSKHGRDGYKIPRCADLNTLMLI